MGNIVIFEMTDDYMFDEILQSRYVFVYITHDIYMHDIQN